MKLQAVPFQQPITWKTKGDKQEAYKGGKLQLSIQECKITFKNGWISQKYKSEAEAKIVAESMLKD